MKEALKELTSEQINFICEVCKITSEELMSLDDEELYDRVYDVMCDIEIEESPSDNSPLSVRGQFASDIVTILGNALRDSFEDEDDCE